MRTKTRRRIGAESSACGARIEAPQAPRGEVWGGGLPPPSGQEGMGERRKFPQRRQRF